METYSYVNIFETMGLEYLLLLSFLVLFVVLVRYLKTPSNNNGDRRKKRPADRRRSR